MFLTLRHMYDAAQAELPSNKPKARSRPSQYQTDEMRSLYARNPHPTREEREELCERIGMYVIKSVSSRNDPHS